MLPNFEFDLLQLGYLSNTAFRFYLNYPIFEQHHLLYRINFVIAPLGRIWQCYVVYTNLLIFHL
nr:MAG TPA: hypothetical protein [Caudoviricetes sp.]